MKLHSSLINQPKKFGVTANTHLIKLQSADVVNKLQVPLSKQRAEPQVDHKDLSTLLNIYTLTDKGWDPGTPTCSLTTPQLRYGVNKKEKGHVRVGWILVLLHTVNKDKRFPHDA